MAQVFGIDDRKARVQPLQFINPAEWQGKAVPERQWLVPGICVRGGATLMNGDGGVGKSLLCMQLQTALALGRPWLGLPTPEAKTRTLGIYCEDDPDELHRRQFDICKYYDCEMDDLGDHVSMISRAGADTNSLMTFDRRSGQGQVTNFYRQVDAMINDQGIEVVIIDTAADTFGGKEIDREEVRTFVQKLRGWAIRTKGAIVITQHPSLSGMASGAGMSGSTGWHNSVRSRVYLTAPMRKDDDGDEIPTNERVLKTMKSNYGPKNAKLRLAWCDGVLKPVGELPKDGNTFFDDLAVQDKILDAAVGYVQKGVLLSPDTNSRTCLVNRVRNDREDMANLSQKVLGRAMDALLREGKLVTVKFKNAQRKLDTYVRPSWLKYQIEEGETE